MGSKYIGSTMIPGIKQRKQLSRLSKSRHQQRSQASGNCMEYILGRDEDNDSDMDDDTSSSDSDYGERTPKHGKLKSSSMGDDPTSNDLMCTFCGRGPFRSLKLHLLHCNVKVNHQCLRCKEFFQTEKSLNEHYMPLYTCEVCGQVFSKEKLYNDHQCPKGIKSCLVLFCSESMPKACNICKSFFTSQETLLNHFNKVHTSVVRRKVCIITKPKSVVPDGVNGSAAPSAIGPPTTASQVINGKLHGSETSSSLSTTSSEVGGPPFPVCLITATASATSEKDGTPEKPEDQPSSSPLSEASKVVSPPAPTIMALFENGSHKVALMKRLNTGWRLKAPHPCRQCGAIFRQPFLTISHRYRHRGQRSHHCQCGRAFKHRLHLLRHCVQHAETLSYICVSCGETFIGAKQLARHIEGKVGKNSPPGQKQKVQKKCKVPFTCDCGRHFFRPSAYIWHQLQNRTKPK
ncbi:hypothetical protein fugu_009913 [Takifugu bimaculatus]|uniref:C2H2-type domain-containing protein n=1 Tax=Takifugu bimaculatus TaxID=433685 RepID=A0A4Z2CDZ1_9TELE|nr:hypothetical protein fugu_009913 [Takifugu bimaculatus]